MGKRAKPVRGKDYEIINGRLEFFRNYLLTLGGCCQQQCLNCPYQDGASRAVSAHTPSAEKSPPAMRYH